MNSLYLDTNFFLYLSNNSSPFYESCLNLIKYSKKNKIFLTTSCETIQEIIYLTKNTKQLAGGIKASEKSLKLVNELLPVTRNTIDIYLEKVKDYRSATSRDLIHLATCVENKITTVITLDRDFSKFKEIKAITPEEFLK